MKLVSDRSFDKVIAEATTLAAHLARLPHVLAIAGTVAHAHIQRVHHRDLKPHNVLVGEFGETVVDWSLAKELDAPAPTAAQPTRDLTFVSGACSGMPAAACGRKSGRRIHRPCNAVQSLDAMPRLQRVDAPRRLMMCLQRPRLARSFPKSHLPG